MSLPHAAEALENNEMTGRGECCAHALFATSLPRWLASNCSSREHEEWGESSSFYSHKVSFVFQVWVQQGTNSLEPENAIFLFQPISENKDKHEKTTPGQMLALRFYFLTATFRCSPTLFNIRPLTKDANNPQDFRIS